jgi:hypothetical protein
MNTISPVKRRPSPWESGQEDPAPRKPALFMASCLLTKSEHSKTLHRQAGRRGKSRTGQEQGSWIYRFGQCLKRTRERSLEDARGTRGWQKMTKYCCPPTPATTCITATTWRIQDLLLLIKNREKRSESFCLHSWCRYSPCSHQFRRIERRNMGKRGLEASTGMGQNTQEINIWHMVSPAMCCGQGCTAAGHGRCNWIPCRRNE